MYYNTGINIQALEIPDDPSEWDSKNAGFVDYFLAHLQEQDIVRLNYTNSKTKIGSTNRYCSQHHFFKSNVNGEKVRRTWIWYSESCGKIFCIYCKFFSESNVSFAKNGFNDWKHNESIHNHETSKSHCQAAQLYVRRIAELGNEKSLLTKQLSEEKQYWRDILKRVFDAVCFLAVRGLPFRGSNGQIGTTHNGNYIGIIELLAKYDPLLRSHIDNYANKEKGHVSYLSPNVAMEFVHLIAAEVKTVIKGEIYSSKYYAFIVDSTPDNSHVDQLTVIIRYVDAKGIAKERFLEFLKETGHKGCEMEDAVIKFLVDNSFIIIDCRGQSYDTAANMSGKYCGLQIRIKQYSPLAVNIPCGGHVFTLICVTQ